MFDSNADNIEDAEFSPRFQWVIPFLLGSALAFMLCALIAASYVLKIGPFGTSDAQQKIQSAVLDATGGIQQDLADAALDMEAAALNAEGAQTFTFGQLKFAGSALQAINELAQAETNGLAKCDPALTPLEGGARAALPLVKCELLAQPPAAPANPAQPGAPAASGPTKPTGLLTFSFADGNVTSIIYAAPGAAATETAEPAAPAPDDTSPGFQAPPLPSAPIETPYLPAASAAPPPQ